MNSLIYLDYAAATPTDRQVAQAMSECLTLEGNFGNPASVTHKFGWVAQRAIEKARKQLAQLIGADPRELVWTSGATESNNLAIKGALELVGNQGHIVTSCIEHKAVLDVCRYLESQGVRVTYLHPDRHGMISCDSVRDALLDDTVFVSVMAVNNELGTVNPVAEIGALCRSRGIVFHVDGAQAVGKIPVDVSAWCVDLLSVSAHKMYGPKGIGALYVCREPKVSVAEQIHGGGHERGMRSGTLPTHQIVGFGTAAKIAQEDLPKEHTRIKHLRERFLTQLHDVADWQLNGHPVDTVPGIINLCFPKIEGETLLAALPELAVSTGSACSSASLEPSYVLKGIGMSDAHALSSIRFSLGRYIDEELLDRAVQHVVMAVQRLS